MEKVNVLREIKEFDIIVAKKFGGPRDNKVRKRPPTPTQMQILEYLLEHQDEDVYQKDLENILNLTRATVSGVLKTMESHKLIDRVTDNVDTRTKKIKLNKCTKEMFDLRKKDFDELEEIILTDVSNEELDSFLKTLTKMKQNVLKTLN